MHRSLRLSVLVLAALTLMAPAALAKPGGLALESGSKLWLVGSSTLHEFSSQASELHATFSLKSDRWPAGVTDGDAVEGLIRAKGVSSMEVVVHAAGLHSGKDGLDRNMHKALLAESYPEIRFRMAGYDVGDGRVASEMSIDAKGTLLIAGVEREIHIAATARREGDGVRLSGSAPLLMSQFGIKPPTMMMGTIRTADQVVVHFDLLLGTRDGAGDMSRAE